jgi:hypothetical protein
MCLYLERHLQMMRRVHYFTRTLTATAWLLLCPVLQVSATDRPASAGMRGSGEPSVVHDVRSWDESRYQEHEFARRYNKLVLALQSFSETYNSGRVIDVKRVKAIKKAWHELEKSDWFKPDNTD